MNDLFGLRNYQSDAVTQIETAWRNGSRAICYQLPTGAGKSIILRTIVDNHYASKKTIYIIAHRRNLVEQLSGHVTEAGIDHGIIMSGAPYIKYRVQVCSLQTLISRAGKLPEAEIIIIDENHHVKSNSYLKIINMWSDSKLLGFTATPRRLDGKGFDDVFDKLICGPNMRTLIDNGYLSDYDYYAPEEVDMSGVKKTGGDYNSKESAERVDKKVITGCAIEHYKKYADGVPAIAACVSIAHCEHVAEQFNEAGIPARAIHSKMFHVEIDKAMHDLKTGTIKILCNCDLISEGVDIPAVTALIGLRPTASEVIFLQQIGRVLRKADGKHKAIILDHVGNYKRHGMPDDERNWSLAPRKKRKVPELSKYKRCPACQRADILRTDRKCPYCGYIFTTEAESDGRIPKQVDGELVKIKAKPVKTYTVYKVGDRATIDARRRAEAEYTYLVDAKSIKQAIWLVYNKQPKRRGEGVREVIDYRGRVIWPKERAVV